jgi:glyoxylase-like metal-dependent hydrolase (beta-lactamase superfamily II)
LLIGDVGRPDLHVTGDAHGQARLLHASLMRLLELPDYVVLYPSHYGGSVCGRGPLLALTDPDAFATAVVADTPPPPTEQARIVAANRSGAVAAPA